MSMTTQPNLAETIARVEAFIDRNLNPGGAANDWLVDDLRALLAAARRCEAMTRVSGKLDDLRLMADSGMSIIPGSTVLDLIDLYEDAAAERDTLAKRVGELEGERDVVRESLLTNFTDAIDRSKWPIARIAGNTEALVDGLRRDAAKANELPGLTATLDELRWELERLRNA